MAINKGAFDTDGTNTVLFAPQTEKTFYPDTLHLYNDHATSTGYIYIQDVAVGGSITVANAYLRVPVLPKTLVILSYDQGDFGKGPNRMGFFTAMTGKTSAALTTAYFTVMGQEVG